MADQEPQGDLVKLTGLWAGKQKKTGAVYLSGTMTPSARLLIFKNKHKKAGSDQPDYIAYICQNRKKEETGAFEEVHADPETGEVL